MPLNVGQLQATMDLDISKFTKNMNSAKKQLKDVGVEVGDMVEVTEDYSQSTEEAAESNQKLNSQVRTATTSVQKQKTETKQAAEQNETWKGSINNVKDAWGKLKGALGALGIVAMVTAMIDKMKEFIQETDAAQKKYEDFINSVQTSTGSAEVSAQIEQMAVSAMNAQKATGNLMYTYEEYADAMVVLSKKYPDLLENEEQMTSMANTYLRFAQVADTDVSDAITNADVMMKKFGVDVEDQEELLNTLYKLYLKTDVPLSDMISLLGEGDRAFQLMGYSAEEAAGYIAAVYQASGELGDVSTLISGIEKLTTTQYGTFGSDAEQSAFIQRVMLETSGMIDETAILNKIDEIYREMFPTIEMDADTQTEVNTNMTEMAKTLSGMAKLGDIKAEDITSIMESSQELNNLDSIQASSEQTATVLEDMYDLLKKQYDLVSTEYETAASLAKLEGVESGNVLGYLNSDEDTAKLYRAYRDASYKTYEDYLMNNNLVSDKFSQTEWETLHDAYKNGTITVELYDQTTDGVAARMKNGNTAVQSTNDPAYS